MTERPASKGEPSVRTVALIALVVSVLALALGGFALYRAGQYRDELHRLGDILVGREAMGTSGLRLEPLPRPPEPDPDPR